MKSITKNIISRFCRSLPLVLLLFFAGPLRAEPKLKKIRIAQYGQAKFLLYLPVYLAEQQGLLAKRGIAVEWSFAGNDEQVFASLISGSADFALSDPVFTAIAAERGFKAKVVAQVVKRLAIYGLARNSAQPEIREPAQLKGLRVSSLPPPSTTFTLLKSLERSLGEGSFQIVPVAIGAQQALLESSRVDLVVDLEPAASLAEAKGRKVVFDLAGFTEPQTITGLMTTDKFLAEHPSEVKALVSGVSESLSAINSSPEQALAGAKEIFPDISAAVLKRAIERSIKSGCYPITAKVNEEDWGRSIKTRVESEELKTIPVFSAVVDNSFYEGK